MKPPPFAYAAPGSLDEALTLLSEYGDDARLLAGGQSLMPMLALRVVRPEVVIDIGRAAAPEAYEQKDDILCVGTAVPQRQLLVDVGIAKAVPLLHEAARYIGHPATRSRGTIVGSLCHADPAAELPLCAVVLGGKFLVCSAKTNRNVAAEDFFTGALTTALASDELVGEVRFPVRPARTGYSFLEIARRHGDFALVAVACWVTVDQAGEITGGRVGLAGVDQTPVCFQLDDRSGLPRADEKSFKETGRAIASRLEPHDDIHATSEYRRAVAAVLIARALRTATDRTKEA